MKLPFANVVRISESKLREYLLSEKHPIGRTKARLFKQFGYAEGQWSILAEDLRAIARQNEVERVEPSPFGNRYVIDAVLHAPDGRELPIRTVWFIDNDEEIPHFVTAYPR